MDFSFFKIPKIRLKASIVFDETNFDKAGDDEKPSLPAVAPKAKATSWLTQKDAESKTCEETPAPKIRRFWAGIIDSLIVAAPIVYMFYCLFNSSHPSGSTETLLANIPLYLLVGSIPFTILSILYNGIWESSGFQGTPGKLILGLKVTNQAGQRLRFFKTATTGRTVVLKHQTVTGKAPDTDVINTPPLGTRFASPYKRLLAFMIDEITIVLLMLLPFHFVGTSIWIMMCLHLFGVTPATAYPLAKSIMTVEVFEISTIVIFLLYTCIFESSRYQTTPGKSLLGLKVVNSNGKSPSWWNCLQRLVVQCVFFLILVVLPWSVMTNAKIALLVPHYLVANCSWVFTALFVLGFYLLPIFTSGKQTFFDQFSDRYVLEVEQDKLKNPSTAHSGRALSYVIPAVLSVYLAMAFSVRYFKHDYKQHHKVAQQTQNKTSTVTANQKKESIHYPGESLVDLAGHVSDLILQRDTTS
jgi:uncharacterized RDD family membrane protein YckC